MHDVAWRGMWICVRSKDAQKQLARTSLNPSGKFVAGVFKSISRRDVFQERFTWKAVVVGLFLAQFLQYGRSSQGNNLPKRQHRKVSLVQFYLSFSIVSHEVFFFVEVSYMFIPRHLCDL